MELVINLYNLVLFSVKAVKDQGLFVDALGHELVVERGWVNVVVMVVIVTVIVLHDISETVRGNWSWAMTTAASNGSQAVLH